MRILTGILSSVPAFSLAGLIEPECHVELVLCCSLILPQSASPPEASSPQAPGPESRSSHGERDRSSAVEPEMAGIPRGRKCDGDSWGTPEQEDPAKRHPRSGGHRNCEIIQWYPWRPIPGYVVITTGYMPNTSVVPETMNDLTPIYYVFLYRTYNHLIYKLNT